MKNNNKITVVITAYNEEKKLAACLDSVGDLASEIIVVDSSSTDNTPSIAKKYTKNVYRRENNLMLNSNKNFGFSKATGEWILSLDADERLTPELKEEILSTLNSQLSIPNGFWIPRKNIIFGKWIQGDMWWPDYQLRFFRRGKGKFPEKHVHEYIHVEGQTEKFVCPMVHYNYDSISQFIYKMDKIYTENESENILKSGKNLSWVDAIRMPLQDFIKTFFAQKGYKNGLHGLVLSLLQAMYMEIVFAKVWEKQGFKEEKIDLLLVKKEFGKIYHDIRYWLITSFINEAKNPLTKLFLRIKRKLNS